MTNEQFIRDLFNINNINLKKFKKEMHLEKFGWDSLIIISLITAINKEFKKSIDAKEILKLKTIGDLDKFISRIKKNK